MEFIYKLPWYISGFCMLGIGGMLAAHHSEEKRKESCAQEAAPLEYLVTEQTIDQVFEDHNGYRIKSRDADGKVLTSFFPYRQLPTRPLFPEEIEGLKGLEDLAQGKAINIYRDLPSGRAKTLTKVTYKVPCELPFDGTPELQYVEIHLPVDEGLSPGNDHWVQGKISYDEPIKEIR